MQLEQSHMLWLVPCSSFYCSNLCGYLQTKLIVYASDKALFMHHYLNKQNDVNAIFCLSVRLTSSAAKASLSKGQQNSSAGCQDILFATTTDVK